MKNLRSALSTSWPQVDRTTACQCFKEKHEGIASRVLGTCFSFEYSHAGSYDGRPLIMQTVHISKYSCEQQ